MMFKNSIKLLCSNFDKVWKLLVYHILSMGICFGLLCVFHAEYSNILNYAFTESNLGSVIEAGTLYGASIATAITKLCNFVIIFFQQLFVGNIGIGVYFCIIAFFVLPLFLNIGKYVTCEMMYGYMSSCQKQSFTGTFLKTLKGSLSYSIVKVIYSLPFNALIALCIWAFTRIESPVFDYILPFVLVLVPALLLSYKSIFISGWAPAQVVYNHNTLSSFSIGFRATIRRLSKIFSTSFVIYLLAIVLSILLGVYSLLIIIPIISPLVHIFDMVAFFSSQGMRFYEDADTIISPKKLEEIDKIEDAKYLL